MNFNYFLSCAELSKQPSYFGDEPDLLFKSAQGRNSLFSTCNGAAAASAAAPATAAATATAIPLSINATAKINLETSLNDCESGYVPTVGRWGAEWPSWLAEASLVRCGAAAASATAVEAAVVVGAGADAGLSAGSVRVGLTTNTVPVQDRPQNNNGQRIVVVQQQQCNVDNKSWSPDNHHDVDETHVDDDNDTGGRRVTNGYDAVGAAAAATTTVDSKIKNVESNMEAVVAGAIAFDSDAIRNFNKVDNVTSSASMERCSNIRKLLEEQHRKWWRNQMHGQQEWWADEDSYNLTAFNQINGIWPLGHPLPLPDWAAGCDDEHTKGVLHFDSVWEYEDLNAIIETKLHRMLEETHYDTVNLFVDFYRAFKRTRRSDLKSFFQFYDLPINRRHHMCVSLAMEIMTRIIKIFPVLQHYLYLVSCEEQVMSQTDYIESTDEVGGLNSPHANVEKEHAMVAMKISIAGREGVMILDPGYHIGRAVTVMSDQMYPHTGMSKQLT